MAVIDYSSGPRITDVGDHVVYTKSSWGASWTAQPNLVCTECAWQAAPEFSSAVLVWRTGYIIPPGSTSATLYGPWVGRGHFVKIVWTCDDASTLVWVGYIDQSGWPTEAFGDQPLVCYGLERALALTPILDHAFVRGGTVMRSAEPPTFELNRAKDPDSVGGVYVFCDPVRDDQGDWRSWSTREIVRYLLKYNCPTNNFGVGAIPWSIDQVTQLPDWDSPRVECRGKTVWDVLCELVGPDKQLGFTVGSDGSTAYLRAFTHTSSTITVSGNSLNANPNQHTLVLSPDALTNASLSDVGGGYDQVICRGAKRQTICTLTHTTNLENDWSSTDETTYEAGASGESAYSTANTQRQREMNSRVRTGAALRNVYSAFKILKTFDWKISTEDLFPSNTNPRDVRIVDRVMIKNDVDWSGAVNVNHYDASGAGQAWGIYFANPDDLTKYVDVLQFEKLCTESVLVGDWPTVSVSAKTEDMHRVRLTVGGAPQHAIAGTNFSRLSADSPSKCWGSLDYTTMKVTCALEEDRYCEGKYPSSAPSADIVRRYVADLGPEYKQIRIHKDTIARIDHEGTAKTVTASGYLRDDSNKLAAIAQIIALGVVLTRKRVNWTSQRRISTIAVGDMINTAEGASVLAPVTSIRINAPTSKNSPAACPTQTFETFGGTQDPLAVLRNLGIVI